MAINKRSLFGVLMALLISFQIEGFSNFWSERMPPVAGVLGEEESNKDEMDVTRRAEG